MKLFTSIRERLRRNDSRHVPSIVKSHANIAYSFIQHEEYLAARQQLLKALERRNDIRDPSILTWLLELLWWTWIFTEQYREAAEFFSTYLQSYPLDARAYGLRAASLWYSGELQRAIEDYSKALELDPQDILAHMGRGQVFAESGEFNHAIEDLDFVHDNLEKAALGDVSRKTQVQAYSFSGRALSHAGLGDFERALSEFDRSIFLCPDNAFVYFNRAVAYENKGRIADAVADYKMSLQKAMPKLTALKRKHAELKVRTIA
jgi:tetratricopeptide (TPR) repeat protein